MIWPEKKDFAFTIIDDTDAGTLKNTKAVYDYLYEKGIFVTKTVWANPPRDEFLGESLSDERYKDFLCDLSRKGFEMASHGPGSGDFSGKETVESFETMERTFGYHPVMFINHAFNKGNLYWGGKRFNPLVAALFRAVKKVNRSQDVHSYGCEAGSPYYWGDYAKEKIRYIRNHVFTGLDTSRYDRRMPYRIKRKDSCSNFWFSSSDGFDCPTFNRLLEPEHVDRLAKNGGFAIVYTHFGYGFVDNDTLDETFKERIDYLARKNGWFVPASELLDYLKENGPKGTYLSGPEEFLLDLKWLVARIIRKLLWKV